MPRNLTAKTKQKKAKKPALELRLALELADVLASELSGPRSSLTMLGYLDEEARNDVRIRVALLSAAEFVIRRDDKIDATVADVLVAIVLGHMAIEGGLPLSVDDNSIIDRLVRCALSRAMR